MAFNDFTFIANETPTTLKWNYIPGNDSYLKDLLEEGVNPGHTHTDSPPTGSLIMWGGLVSAIPSSFLLCNGQAVSRTTYAALYAIIGNQFGAGDGSTTFNVPDFRDRFPVGAGSLYTANAQGGANTIDISHTHSVTLTHSHGSHSHTVNDHTHAGAYHQHHAGGLRAKAIGGSGATYFHEDGGYGGWTANTRVAGGTFQTGSFGGVSGASVVDGYTDIQQGTTGGSTPGTNSATISYTGSVTSGSGGSSAVNNRPPYIGIFFLIKT